MPLISTGVLVREMKYFRGGLYPPGFGGQLDEQVKI